MRRVCLLTGASGLLGHRLIERLAPRYRIVAVHHTAPVDYASQDQFFVDPLAPDDDVEANAFAVHTVCADLSCQEEAARVVGEALTAFGGVDVLVHAAGRRRWASLLAAESSRTAAEVFAVNTLAGLWLAAELARQSWTSDPEENLRQNRNVVTVASSAGLYVYPDLGQGVYAASKAALIQLSYHLASEFWDLGVRVNTIAPDTFPGRVPTDQVVDAIVAFDEGDQTGQLTTLLGPSR
jgi:NAD(P)-dependent dehydrogenase (short-subunit alcohol dehydrogenase family)